ESTQAIALPFFESMVWNHGHAHSGLGNDSYPTPEMVERKWLLLTLGDTKKHSSVVRWLIRSETLQENVTGLGTDLSPGCGLQPQGGAPLPGLALWRERKRTSHSCGKSRLFPPRCNHSS